MTDLQALRVEELKHVGLQTAAILQSKNVLTVGDLLARLPRRYIDLRAANDWGLVEGKVIGATVAVAGTITDQRSIGHPRSRGLSLLLRDLTSGTVLRIVFFRAPPGLAAKVPLGASVRVIGVLREGNGDPELHQPKILAPTAKYEPIEPVYSSIGSLSSASVGKLIASALARSKEWAEIVPPAVAKEFAVSSAQKALLWIHRPPASVGIDELVRLQRETSAAHQRLAFEELLTMMITVERMRAEQGTASPIHFDREKPVVSAIEERLAIKSTDAQRAAILEIVESMDQSKPMRKLLVGDVGSGKTAVAAAASLAALRAGKSVLWLAPTAIVAQQHAQTLTRAFKGEGGPIAVLLGSTAKRAKTAALKAIAGGLVNVVVGTHAVLDENALPPQLGLAVIDEQHRFGVAQRRKIVEQRPTHLLVLSATPIPRTLALAQFGDLDIVTMRGVPEGRQPITSRTATLADEAFIAQTITRALSAGGKIFVVVPRIEPDEYGKACIATADALLSKYLPKDRISVLHGKLSSDAQQDVLHAFRQGSHPVMVCTSIVEVGIDVPDANLMVILGAEHFGLAQLHQLRGRVGRGGQKAACLFVAETPSDETMARLKEVAECSDGFALAERDLARRGAGEWFGERQSGGDKTLHFADPVRDQALLFKAAELARSIVETDPTFAEHQPLLRASERLLARIPAPTAEDAG